MEGGGYRVGGTFWVPVTLPSPLHFLKEGEQGSQGHLAWRYLQICCANNHPHNTTQLIVPQQGSSAQNPGEVPHKNPPPCCLSNTLAPGSARPSYKKTRCFPRGELRERFSDVAHLPFRPSLQEPTRVSRARGQEAGRSPPKSALTRSPAPSSISPPPSFLPAPVPAPPAPPVPQWLCRLREGNFFRG